MKVALVTGGSSGIGRATAELFRSRGWRVASFSRREGVDVTDAAAVRAALARVLAETGRVDVLVNNAGVGSFGAAETTSDADVRRQFEVNFFAAVELTRQVLPVMRRQGGGRIVSVASAAALFPLPYQAAYTATKAALLAWSRALAGEVRRFGVRVSAVCPGDVRTAFTDARRAFAGVESAYSPFETAARRKAEASEASGAAPEAVARAVFLAATAARPPLVLVPGAGYAWLDRLARLMPRSWVSRAVERFYA